MRVVVISGSGGTKISRGGGGNGVGRSEAGKLSTLQECVVVSWERNSLGWKKSESAGQLRGGSQGEGYSRGRVE